MHKYGFNELWGTMKSGLTDVRRNFYTVVLSCRICLFLLIHNRSSVCQRGIVISNRATIEYSYSVSYFRTNRATVFLEHASLLHNYGLMVLVPEVTIGNTGSCELESV